MKILKGLILTIISYILLRIFITLSFGTRFLIDSSLISLVNKESNTNPFNFLDTIHYGNLLIVLAILGASFFTSLIGRKFGFKKRRVFFSFMILWFLLIFIFPLFIKK